MKKKINAKFRLISAIAITVTALCAMLLFYNILKNEIFDDLKANAHVIAALRPEEMEGDFHNNLSEDGLRITLIAEDGTVVFDSNQDITQMENHQSREEIASAFATGEGQAMRKSATSSKHTFYYAMLREDGIVLRIGKDSTSIYKFIINMIGLIAVVGISVFVLCAILAKRLTSRLVAPIEKLADNIILVEEETVYDELKPFVAMIKHQHMDILENAKMRQEFTANVSHELKTPLTAISGYAELIKSGMTNSEDTIHFAGEIHHSAERLQSLINDIIKLSELDSNDLKLEYEQFDLRDIANNCVQMMKFSAEKNEVTLSVEGDSLPIHANRMLMEELVFNLCSNAVRYNQKGGSVTISLYKKGEQPVIAVKDTGIGISKEHQERIFERFYRVDKSRSKSTGGTGLGLAIVKHIVAQHDAQIEIDSQPGVGTEIRVIFKA